MEPNEGPVVDLGQELGEDEAGDFEGELRHASGLALATLGGALKSPNETTLSQAATAVEDLTALVRRWLPLIGGDLTGNVALASQVLALTEQWPASPWPGAAAARLKNALDELAAALADTLTGRRFEMGSHRRPPPTAAAAPVACGRVVGGHLACLPPGQVPE